MTVLLGKGLRFRLAELAVHNVDECPVARNDGILIPVVKKYDVRLEDDFQTKLQDAWIPGALDLAEGRGIGQRRYRIIRICVIWEIERLPANLNRSSFS